MGNVAPHQHQFNNTSRYCHVIGCGALHPRWAPAPPVGADSFADAERNITINYTNAGAQFRRIMHVHLPAWARVFEAKNAEYGDNAQELGVPGQFADIWRKISKLRTAMWEGHPERLTSESTEQVIMDLIGHLFLTLDMLPEEYR
jgi:hypothetical protein